MTLPDHLVAGEVPNCHVWLDGVEQRYVVEAHTTEGWIIRTRTDEAGEIIVEGDEIATERLFGVVTAELMEPAA